jgi:putative ABC transport system permease protein
MINHYLKTTYRHLKRSKINFAFKLGGLTLALLSLLVIGLYVSYQLSFDKFHSDYENIYRVNSNRSEDGAIVPYSMVPPAIGPALKGALPEIVEYARFGVPSRVMIQYQEKLFRLTGFLEADSSIFNVLTFTFLRGNKTALHLPGSIVLTQSLATQIFGNEDPMGKVITSPDHSNKTLHVRGIIADYPSNSHLLINAIHSFGSLQTTNVTSWEITWDGSVNLFVKLQPFSNPEEVSKKALPLLRKNLAAAEDGSEKAFSISLQPISGVYLDKALKMEFSKKGNAIYIYIFSLLGVFLLIIASINYVNLSIADYDSRSREMGVRKVLGARKAQLGFQIALEATMISLIALLIAVTLLYQFFPLIAEKLDQNLRFNMLLDRHVLLPFSGALLCLITFSSVYPWYRLTYQHPVVELKSTSGYGKSMSVGKILLLIQYSISVLCICMTLIVGKQISFVQSKDLGYDRSHVISLIMPDEYPAEKVPVLKNELGRLAGIESVSYSYYLMPVSTYFKGWYQVEQNGTMKNMLLNEMFVDHDYFETMGINLIDGRNFQLSNSMDVENAFIINETAAKDFGWINPLGKKMITGYDDGSKRLEGTVIGVVKDFNTLSLHKKIEPVVLRLPYDSWPGNSLNVKFQGDVSEMLPIITATYEKLMPGFLADARVLEDLFKNQYKNENNAYAALQVSTLIIILISALGIFSLSLYMSVKRMREFGIRKVLGATSGQIAALHVSYFFRIGLLANIIALPVAYWLIREWLNNFAYQTEVSILIFLIVTVASFAVVILSGSYSAWKAGTMNPVDVIKIQ